MKMLKDAREVQQRMDTIEQELARKKITLNDAERASILAKVQAIQNYKYVQQEADRIMEEITGRSEEHTSELQSLMRSSYAVFCLKKKKNITSKHQQKANDKN